MPPARSSLQWACQELITGSGGTKSSSGQVTTDAPSPSLMTEEPSQLIYQDKIFQRLTLSIAGSGASCLVCRYKCLLWMSGGWFGQRPEAFNVPFAQQEAQSNTWQRVTALWPWLELSDHHTRKHCIPCLHPGLEVTTQKVDPQLQERKITLGTFCLFWEAHQYVPFILQVWGHRGKCQ